MASPYTPDQPRTKAQNARLFTLLGKLRLGEDERHELAFAFSDGRTSSTRELRAYECNNLIHHLEKMLKAHPEEVKHYNMRRKVFSLAHQLGWELPNGKVDMVRLNGFCLKRTACKKPLLAMTVKELVAVVTQLENINDKQHG